MDQPHNDDTQDTPLSPRQQRYVLDAEYRAKQQAAARAYYDRQKSDPEWRAKHNAAALEAKRRYRERYANDPDYRAHQRELRKAQHERMKSDPEYMAKRRAYWQTDEYKQRRKELREARKDEINARRREALRQSEDLRQKRSEENRRWREKNRETLREKRLTAYQENPELVRQHQREYYAANRDRIQRGFRARNLARYYGLTFEMVDEIIAKQGGVCPLCLRDLGEHPTKTNGYIGYQIDHDHGEQDIVRGVLCQPCNLRLGQVENMAPDWLDRARAYLVNPTVRLPRPPGAADPGKPKKRPTPPSPQ